ncbi:MAG: glycosyltransferase family A protein [Sarcina sp.]
MYNKISLIMATYGREVEVENFLKSLLKSDYDLKKIQIIIVDQNEKIDLSKIILKYNSEVYIKHIKSKQRGLSINRNIGIKCSHGDIIAFPDDDCEYLVDTLKTVNELFIKNKDLSCVMGKIVERDGSDSLRKWPEKSLEINKSNFYTKCSSITMFYKMDKSIVKFNEYLGVGQKMGSCEDTDILYKNLKNGANIKYTPKLMIYHPHYDSKTNMTLDKIKSYSLGFGAFAKANKDFHIFLLMSKILPFHLIKSFIYLLKLDLENSKKSYIAFSWRIKGFIN